MNITSSALVFLSNHRVRPGGFVTWLYSPRTRYAAQTEKLAIVAAAERDTNLHATKLSSLNNDFTLNAEAVPSHSTSIRIMR